ncbi:MAG TPA: 16S rRNA (adenine(1518)-N(6)/adenine(1519)-N(6))-dimethyltransferase RsmA [Burkholderiaceae bacterium]|nr:16S rRNA (adenine(1518)-N(6)/adenine(1519)-N(6))-dimethyltransferase RsmA [Burkholderiaceae bacterium]
MSDHRARKRFGQNFLVDGAVIEAIVDAIAPRAGDRIVEIGPGLAALTRALLQRLPRQDRPLRVIEIDRDLVARLRRDFHQDDLAIHEGDALDVNFTALARDAHGPLRIVGNLPYNISSPLLFHLATHVDAVVDQHFMLQREVVERMIAEPGSSAFGRLSVMLQVRYAMEQVLDVPPEAFDPAPKVHSAVVRMQPLARDAWGLLDAELFARIVAAGFSQRRKMLRNTLAEYFAEVGEDTAIALGVLPTARAEAIGVSTWVAFTNAVVRSRAAQRD